MPSPVTPALAPTVARAGTPSPARSTAIVAALLGLYFGVWGLLRPPLQTPDEPQHLMKANSILLQPWKSTPGQFDLDRRFVNPLALDTPEPIDKLFFKPFNAMTPADIEAVERVPWPDRTQPGPPLAPYARAIASYPSPYYLAVFALAEPLVRGFAFSPYQATFAYRLATAALAALLWALVWAALIRMPDTSAHAAPLFALTIVNPMLAFISSGVTPDAVNNPLCNLGLILLWRVAASGAGAKMAFVVLLAAALTKPSGLQLSGVAAGVLMAFAGLRLVNRRRAARAVAVAIAAAVISVVVFYYWSPPRFMAGGPSPDTFGQYLATRVHALGFMWRMVLGSARMARLHGESALVFGGARAGGRELRVSHMAAASAGDGGLVLRRHRSPLCRGDVCR